MFNGAIIAVDMSSGMKFKEKVAIRKIITDNGGYMTFTVNKEVSKICLKNNEHIIIPYNEL